MSAARAPRREPEPDDEAELPEDVAALKRACDARGISLRVPSFGLRWTLPEPIDFGVSLGDIVVRLRGNDR